MIRDFGFPVPDENNYTEESSSMVQFGLYVLKDSEGNYQDLESLAIHTLNKDLFFKSKNKQIQIKNFKKRVKVVLGNFRVSSKLTGVDISSKQSKRELAVCLATFPEYEGNPRPILQRHFNYYFDIFNTQRYLSIGL